MKDDVVRHTVPIILLVDGQCLLCNSITHFVIKRDKAKLFRFATLQSSIGQQLLQEGNLPLEDIDTFVMVNNGEYHTKSDAALRVLGKLGGWWRTLSLLKIVPRPLRNAVYDIIARHRYRWFGKADRCILPTRDLLNRFVSTAVHPVSKQTEEASGEK